MQSTLCSHGINSDHDSAVHIMLVAGMQEGIQALPGPTEWLWCAPFVVQKGKLSWFNYSLHSDHCNDEHNCASAQWTLMHPAKRAGDLTLIRTCPHAEFEYPSRWLADQRLLQRYATRIEQRNPLDLPSLQKCVCPFLACTQSLALLPCHEWR